MTAQEPFDALAAKTIEASRGRSVTPVFVIPCSVRFRTEFFGELTHRIISISDFSRVRFDWLVGESLMRNRLSSRTRFWSTRRYVSKLNRSLQKHLQSQQLRGTIELASQFSRPTLGPCLAIGISHSHDAIPRWCSPIVAKPVCTY